MRASNIDQSRSKRKSRLSSRRHKTSSRSDDKHASEKEPQPISVPTGDATTDKRNVPTSLNVSQEPSPAVENVVNVQSVNQNNPSVICRSSLGTGRGHGKLTGMRIKDHDKLADKNGLRHTVFSNNGDVYIGEWSDNLKSGRGIWRGVNNLLYEGNWKNGLQHGYGLLSLKNADGSYCVVYEGDWVNGRQEGYGRIWIWKKYGQIYCFENEHYEGDVRNGLRWGTGCMRYKDSSFYHGEWYKNVRHGIGVYLYADGNRYKGEWETDVKCGMGEFYHKHTGQVQRGLWINDNAVCSTMEDVCRQAAVNPTPYPIPINSLKDYEQVFDDEVRGQWELNDKKNCKDSGKLETESSSHTTSGMIF